MNGTFKKLVLLAGIAILFGTLTGCLKRDSGTNNTPDDDGSQLVDTDHDGIPNVSDDDIDNDGKPNIADNDIDGDGIPNTSDNDIDGDGVVNIDDNDIDGDGVVNTEDNDIDGNGIVNTEDNDIDGDGIINIDDNDIDGDGIANTEDQDIDGDGTANDQDTDIDGDGIVNTEDSDIDGDGVANTEDPDIDGDGTANTDDPTQGGTGDVIAGTEGDTNTGDDTNTGTTNTGTDTDTGETGDDDYVSGIGVVAVDTVAYTLKIPNSQSTGVVSTYETINLDQVRDEIENNDIALSTFDLTGLSIIASGSNSFVQANSGKKIVVTVSYLDANDNKVAVLQSAATNGPVASVLTIGDLAAGLQLDEDIFAASAGFNDFTGMIKDESKSSISTVIEINFLDAPTGGTDLKVSFILRATGKKPL